MESKDTAITILNRLETLLAEQREKIEILESTIEEWEKEDIKRLKEFIEKTK